MARIEIDVNTRQPRCTGCGAQFYYTPYLLDSRRRTEFDGTGDSSGREIAAFAEKHRDCPEPRIEQSLSGLVITDRRIR
jgi:hypothetical protein